MKRTKKDREDKILSSTWRMKNDIEKVLERTRREDKSIYYSKLERMQKKDEKEQIREALEEAEKEKKASEESALRRLEEESKENETGKVPSDASASERKIIFLEEDDDDSFLDMEPHDKSPPDAKRKALRDQMEKDDKRRAEFKKAKLGKKENAGFTMAKGSEEAASEGFQKSSGAVFEKSTEEFGKKGAEEGFKKGAEGAAEAAKDSGGGTPYGLIIAAAEKSQEQIKNAQMKMIEDNEKQQSEYHDEQSEREESVGSGFLAWGVLIIMLSFLPSLFPFFIFFGAYQAVLQPVEEVVEYIDEATDEFRLVTWAVSKIGCEYDKERRDQEDPDVFDCSSFTRRGYATVGITLEDTAADQGKQMEDAGYLIEEDEMKAGDLIFYSFEENGRYKNISHVSIYVGLNMTIHAFNEEKGVTYSKYTGENVIFIARPFKVKEED